MSRQLFSTRFLNLQRESNPAPALVRDVLRSSGRPLDAATRSFAERRFDHDFSHVRVHDDTRAAQSALAVEASAYTVGKDIVFGSGARNDRRILLHELTHVVQQSGTTADPSQLTLGPTDDIHEREADAISRSSVEAPSQRAVNQRVARATIMRAPLFSSTLHICRRLLKSRIFPLSQGGLSVTAEASWGGSEEWQGDGPPDCGANTYNIALSAEGKLFDTHYANREYVGGEPFTRTWGNVPTGNYYLTIWTNNTNPTCCLDGTITVTEEAKSTKDDPSSPKRCGPDVTEWTIAQMQTNAKSEAVASLKKRNAEDWKGIDLGAMSDFEDLVKTGAIWDFKKDLGDAINVAPCRQNCNGRIYSVTLGDHCMSYEAPANIHFGYIGRAAGFSEAVLLRFAGLAQVVEFRGETKDDVRDVQAIRKGFALFNAGSPSALDATNLDLNYYENLGPNEGDPAGCEPCSKKI